MDEQTVNEPEIFEEADFAQTEENNSPAVEETTEQSTSQEEGDSVDGGVKDTSQPEDDVEKFLANKGIKMDDPDALRKVADMYRNVEKEFGKKSQEKAQLERALANSAIPEVRPDRQALAEVRALKVENSVEKWKSAKNLSPADEQKMLDYIDQPLRDNNGNVVINPQTRMPFTKGFLVLNGALSLDDVYRLSGCENVNTKDLRENIRKEIVKEMNARQNVKRPSVSATNSNQFGEKPTSGDSFADALLGED